MAINRGLIEEFYNGLDERSREALDGKRKWQLTAD